MARGGAVSFVACGGVRVAPHARGTKGVRVNVGVGAAVARRGLQQRGRMADGQGSGGAASGGNGGAGSSGGGQNTNAGSAGVGIGTAALTAGTSSASLSGQPHPKQHSQLKKGASANAKGASARLRSSAVPRPASPQGAGLGASSTGMSSPHPLQPDVPEPPIASSRISAQLENGEARSAGVDRWSVGSGVAAESPTSRNSRTPSQDSLLPRPDRSRVSQDGTLEEEQASSLARSEKAAAAAAAAARMRADSPSARNDAQTWASDQAANRWKRKGQSSANRILDSSGGPQDDVGVSRGEGEPLRNDQANTYKADPQWSSRWQGQNPRANANDDSDGQSEDRSAWENFGGATTLAQPSGTDWVAMDRGVSSVDRAEQMRIDGKEALRMGKLELARDLFRSCVETDRMNGKGWQEFAKMEGVLRGGQRGSIRVLKQALRALPNNAHLWQSLGLLHYRCGALQAARDAFQRGLDADVTHASLYAAWGKVEAMQGNVELARELFTTGLEMDEGSTRVYHSWSHMEYKHGNVEKAVELLERGLQYESTNSYLWQYLGQIALDMGRWERARECFEHAVHDPRDKDDLPSIFAFDSYGRMEMTFGNEAAAKALFLEARKLFPRDVRPLQCLGLLAMKNAEYPEAKQWLEASVRVSQRDYFLWYILGLVEYRLGNSSRARALFKRAAEISPSDWKIWNTWSLAEWEAGELDVSMKLLMRASKIKYNIEGDFCPFAESIDDLNEQALFYTRLFLPRQRDIAARESMKAASERS
ncbi:Protein high chlorophyll fluorescent [Porphyridium purpureum]|uniref:Protein high chlorophyll fluorescent n=1 Tax=Porphyridium purpureum TaxID=35688 RepID=A0A5J4YJJ4_PORPP|nr:Protein high chlorophyll fluorescent [Porphyridium purpureum]|eukprot:POR2693..scf289_17